MLVTIILHLTTLLLLRNTAALSPYYTQSSGYWTKLKKPNAKPFRYLKDLTKYEDETKGCSYGGYKPYSEVDISQTDNVMAKIQLTAVQDAMIHSDFVIGRGVASGFQEVLDAEVVTNKAQKWSKYDKATMENGLKKFQWKRGVGKFVKNFARGLSPTLGILVAAFDAVAGVETPTHHDILDATNKALKQMTNQIDQRMAEVKTFVSEKVNMLEKDINNRKYSYLFTYWTKCATLASESEVNLCQREAYRLIDSAIDDFLLYHTSLDPETGTFNGLTEDNQRRIELGMMSFRNYATLTVLCVDALKTTYDILKNTEESKNSKGEDITSCLTMKNKEQENENDETYKSPVNLQYYCLFKDKTIENARYFEKYGRAAIQETKKVAAARLDKMEISKTEEVYKSEKSVWVLQPNYRESNYVPKRPRENLLVWEREVKCEAKLHQFKGTNCKYDVQLLESPEHEKKYWNTQVNGKMKKDAEGFYTSSTFSTDIPDGVLINGPLVSSTDQSGKLTLTAKWCHDRLNKRLQDYKMWEQEDLHRYWAREVMQVIVCQRMMAEGVADDCGTDSMQEFYPLALERIIALESLSSGSGRAIDGLLSTMTWYSKIRQPSWSAHMKEKARIKEIQFYIFEDPNESDTHFTNVKVEIGAEADQNGQAKSWATCKDLSLRKGTSYMKTPLIVKCDDSSAMVEFIKFTVKDQGEKTLNLAEVRVIGYITKPETPAKATDVIVALEVGEQSSDEKDNSNAIDGQVHTYSETGEEDGPAWYIVQLVNTETVTKVRLDLVGKYKKIEIHTSMTGSDDTEEEWSKCGEGVNVDGFDLQGFQVDCKGQIKGEYVRIKAMSNSNNGKNILKIREITVYGLPRPDADPKKAPAGPPLQKKI